MFERLVGFVRYAAKAVAAAVLPVLSFAGAELVTDLRTYASQLVAAAVGAVFSAFGVYWTRNSA